ncbi:MAG: glycosyltransferase family 4 protein [Candidatus Anammoxibacter sp.]
MKILHLFSNWKWTGPAEPALNLAISLQRLGHDVSFACGNAPNGSNNLVAMKAIDRGVTPITEFNLSKHFRLVSNLRDISRLKKFIKNEQFDIVHTHLPNDHLVGGLAAKKSGSNVLTVRTDYSGKPLTRTLRNRYLIKKLTDGLIVISEKGRAGNIERFNLSETIVQKIEGAIDLNRFNPENKRQDFKKSLGIEDGDVVVGIVARVQRHRQFDVLLKAISIALKAFPRLKLLIIGRGTHINEIAVEPVKEMDINRSVIFAGYRRNDYVDVLACMDINIFLVPGSDGSCRAVREVMAMGKPVIASKRGILPELVVDGQTGLIVNEKAEDMADAILRLTNNKELRDKLGVSSRKKAVKEFNLEKQAEIVEKFYYSLKQS